MRHISTRDWDRFGGQLPNQFQSIPGVVYSDGSTEEKSSELGSLHGEMFAPDVNIECGGQNKIDAEALCTIYQSHCFLLILELVSTFFEIPVESLRGQTRGTAPICQARQICMYLLHTSLSLSYPEIGQLFRRDRTTISHACMVVEDLRDDGRIDKTLSRLESILTTIRALLGGVAGDSE